MTKPLTDAEISALATDPPAPPRAIRRLILPARAPWETWADYDETGKHKRKRG